MHKRLKTTEALKDEAPLMAFDLGSFDEASDLEKPALSWRLVPAVSLSDWVIKVETEGADPL